MTPASSVVVGDRSPNLEKIELQSLGEGRPSRTVCTLKGEK